MIVKFFYKVGPRAYALSFAFSLAAISLINYCKYHEDWALNNILEIFVLWAIFALFTIYVTFLQSKKLSSKLSGVHLLTFPCIFLFFPNGPGLVIPKIIIGLILVYAEHLFFLAIYSKSKYKYLFDLSIFISIIVLFNKALLIFYVFPILVVFSEKLFSIKSFIALFLPIILVPFTFYGLSTLAPTNIFGVANHIPKIQLLGYLDQTSADWVWFVILLISIYVSIFKPPKESEKSTVFLFMKIWLYLSIFIGFLGLNLGQERWLLSFIPSAFFFGHLIEKMRSEILKNAIFFLGLIFIVFFKLFHFEVLKI